MQIGKLRHRITIQYPSPTQDATNDPVVSWRVLATVWADVRPAGSQERLQRQADQVVAQVDQRVRMRYRSDITTQMRVKWGTRYFDIEGVNDPDGRRRELRLDCREVQ